MKSFRTATTLITRVVFALVPSFVFAQSPEANCPVPPPGYSSVSMLGSQSSSYAGQVTKHLGDINGDGYPDYAVVAPGYRYNGMVMSGLIYVIYGNPGQQRIHLSEIGPDVSGGGQKGFVIAGNREMMGLGFSAGANLAAVGDLDGDGYDDFILGDYGYAPDIYGHGQGALYVFYGGPATGETPAFPSVIDLATVPGGVYGDRVALHPERGINLGGSAGGWRPWEISTAMAWQTLLLRYPNGSIRLSTRMVSSGYIWAKAIAPRKSIR